LLEDPLASRGFRYQASGFRGYLGVADQCL
jgi:hypothetical protein